MPNEPVMSIHELARCCWCKGSQRRYPVSGAIRQALTPTPMSTRASKRPEKSCAQENAKLPTTATHKKRSTTWRGPKVSSQRPMGSWVKEKPKK